MPSALRTRIRSWFRPFDRRPRYQIVLLTIPPLAAAIGFVYIGLTQSTLLAAIGIWCSAVALLLLATSPQFYWSGEIREYRVSLRLAGVTAAVGVLIGQVATHFDLFRAIGEVVLHVFS